MKEEVEAEDAAANGWKNPYKDGKSPKAARSQTPEIANISGNSWGDRLNQRFGICGWSKQIVETREDRDEENFSDGTKEFVFTYVAKVRITAGATKISRIGVAVGTGRSADILEARNAAMHAAFDKAYSAAESLIS